MKSLVGRLPFDEAPEVIRYFLGHNDQFYVRSMHPVGILLRDAEKLRTEWATGRRVMTSQAREIERMQHNHDSFAQAAKILSERKP